MEATRRDDPCARPSLAAPAGANAAHSRSGRSSFFRGAPRVGDRFSLTLLWSQASPLASPIGPSSTWRTNGRRRTFFSAASRARASLSPSSSYRRFRFGEPLPPRLGAAAAAARRRNPHPGARHDRRADRRQPSAASPALRGAAIISDWLTPRLVHRRSAAESSLIGFALSLVIGVAVEIRRLVGGELLTSVLLGTYHRPTRQRLIVMFLDHRPLDAPRRGDGRPARSTT